jgi:hypothetical protein
VRKQVPGIKVFGGITLNGAVGGLNPRAVELNEAAGITRDQIQTMGRETPPRS